MILNLVEKAANNNSLFLNKYWFPELFDALGNNCLKKLDKILCRTVTRDPMISEYKLKGKDFISEPPRQGIDSLNLLSPNSLTGKLDLHVVNKLGQGNVTMSSLQVFTYFSNIAQIQYMQWIILYVAHPYY
jgi:hypothetical protein